MSQETKSMAGWFGIQLNPHFLGIDLIFFFARAEMMGWLLINLSVLGKCFEHNNLRQSMILYQLFCLGWWLMHNKVELTTAAVIANCFVFLIGGIARHFIYFGDLLLVLPFSLPCGMRGIARHFIYFGDLLLVLPFSLPCGMSSPIPYFYPVYLLILLIWRERRDEARCAEKYKDVWAEYCRVVPWRILPYVY